MITSTPKKPFSMIREFHLADWFTLANAVCGIGAIFSIMTYLEQHDVRHVYYACSLVLVALVFDVFDGRIARWRKKTSILGRELDSLADIISFGVAPANHRVRLRYAGSIPIASSWHTSLPAGSRALLGTTSLQKHCPRELTR